MSCIAWIFPDSTSKEAVRSGLQTQANKVKCKTFYARLSIVFSQQIFAFANFACQIKLYHLKKRKKKKKCNSSYRHWFSLSSCLFWWARLKRLLVSAASISSISQRRSSRIAVRIRRRSSMSIVLSSYRNREQVSFGNVKDYLEQRVGEVRWATFYLH